MENLQFGLLLMVAGMLTVFAILLIVIYGSKLLITILNKIVPAEKSPAPVPEAAVGGETRAVLEAAVREITGGRGRIVKITKI